MFYCCPLVLTDSFCLFNINFIVGVWPELKKLHNCFTFLLIVFKLPERWCHGSFKKKHKRNRRQSNETNLSETNTKHSMMQILVVTCYLHKVSNKTKRPVPDRKEKHIDFGFSDLTGRPVDHFATFKEDTTSHVRSSKRKTTGCLWLGHVGSGQPRAGLIKNSQPAVQWCVA